MVSIVPSNPFRLAEIAEAILVEPTQDLPLVRGSEPVLRVLVVEELERSARDELAVAIALWDGGPLEEAYLQHSFQDGNRVPVLDEQLEFRALVDAVDRQGVATRGQPRIVAGKALEYHLCQRATEILDRLRHALAVGHVARLYENLRIQRLALGQASEDREVVEFRRNGAWLGAGLRIAIGISLGDHAHHERTGDKVLHPR